MQAFTNIFLLKMYNTKRYPIQPFPCHDSRPWAARVHLYNYNIIIPPKLPNKLRTFFLLIVRNFCPILLVNSKSLLYYIDVNLPYPGG